MLLHRERSWNLGEMDLATGSWFDVRERMRAVTSDHFPA